MSDDSESVAIDIVAEEVLRQIRRGERPSLSGYVTKYPALEVELRSLFPALRLLEHFADRTLPQRVFESLSHGLPDAQLNE